MALLAAGCVESQGRRDLWKVSASAVSQSCKAEQLIQNKQQESSHHSCQGKLAVTRTATMLQHYLLSKILSKGRKKQSTGSANRAAVTSWHKCDPSQVLNGAPCWQICILTASGISINMTKLEVAVRQKPKLSLFNLWKHAEVLFTASTTSDFYVPIKMCSMCSQTTRTCQFTNRLCSNRKQNCSPADKRHFEPTSGVDVVLLQLR